MRPEGAEGLPDDVENMAHSSLSLYGDGSQAVPALDADLGTSGAETGNISMFGCTEEGLV